MFEVPSMFRRPSMFSGVAQAATGVDSEWCLSFDGVDDRTSYFGDTMTASAFTLASWVKRDAGQYGFIASYYSGNYCGLELYPTVTYIECGPTQYASVSHSADGLWHHYAIVFDGLAVGNSGRLKLYIDGALQALTYVGTIPSHINTRFAVGYRDWSSYYAKMMADDVRVFSRALSATEVGYLYNNTQNVTDGLTAYLDMEEGTGGTTAVKDGTGATIATATLTGGPTWHPQTPPKLVSGRETLTHSLGFDANNDHVLVPDILSESSWTIGLWVYQTDSAVYSAPIIFKMGSFIGNGIVRSGTSWFPIRRDTYNVACGVPLVLNSWVHLMATWDGVDLRLYCNGVLGSVSGSGGGWGVTTSRFGDGYLSLKFGGRLSTATYFARALSYPDIARLARGQRPVTDDPVGRWKLDEGSGTTAIDYGSGGNNGTLTGGPTYSTDVPAWLQA